MCFSRADFHVCLGLAFRSRCMLWIAHHKLVLATQPKFTALQVEFTQICQNNVTSLASSKPSQGPQLVVESSTEFVGRRRSHVKIRKHLKGKLRNRPSEMHKIKIRVEDIDAW